MALLAVFRDNEEPFDDESFETIHCRFTSDYLCKDVIEVVCRHGTWRE